jgi:hypothetical protein
VRRQSYLRTDGEGCTPRSQGAEGAGRRTARLGAGPPAIKKTLEGKGIVIDKKVLRQFSGTMAAGAHFGA